jgi:hypothetical protein
MRTTPGRILRIPLLAVAVACLAGCDEQPRAPALVNEAVYTNDAIGLSFVAPEGWVLFAKAELPPGQHDRPMRLVAYQQTAGDTRTNFELYAIDVPKDQGLMAYLAKQPIGPEKWKARGEPAAVTINGARAVRYSEAGIANRSDMRRDLVEFRRPDRVYLFVTTYKASDAKAREQATRAVESATWK